jgi:hypothetical protein
MPPPAAHPKSAAVPAVVPVPTAATADDDALAQQLGGITLITSSSEGTPGTTTAVSKASSSVTAQSVGGEETRAALAEERSPAESYGTVDDVVAKARKAFTKAGESRPSNELIIGLAEAAERMLTSNLDDDSSRLGERRQLIADKIAQWASLWMVTCAYLMTEGNDFDDVEAVVDQNMNDCFITYELLERLGTAPGPSTASSSTGTSPLEEYKRKEAELKVRLGDCFIRIKNAFSQWKTRNFGSYRGDVVGIALI